MMKGPVASGIVDVCTPAFLIYAVVRTLRMRAKQQYYAKNPPSSSAIFFSITSASSLLFALTLI